MENIRNVCILAHVDHGKTSLADNLLYSNGIISKTSAGDLRHLDSTQDEQERGITMKSSCISLRHTYNNKLRINEEKKNYIINLIDSPGHVDFNGEVSTAVKISDNAFIVVDVIEGVCPQTRTVIQQAWKERLNFILVLNKIDRMYFELKLNSMDAYNKLVTIIEDVHHIIGELISFDIREEEEKDDSILSPEYISKNYDTNPFHPLKQKVIFCSAFHQWGFRISDFVPVYSEVLNIDKLQLFKKMWGDFYINKKKEICPGASDSGKKNIFTSLIIDQIWSVYKAFEANEIDNVVKMMSKLNVKVELRKNNRDSQIDNIRNVLRGWMPLPTVLFDTLVETCPNPRAAITDKRLTSLVPNEIFSKARNIIKTASTTSDSAAVAFITKFMFQSSTNNNNNLIGLGRIYSGQFKPDLKVFVFTPRFNPLKVLKSFYYRTPDEFEEGPISVYVETVDKNSKDSSHVYVAHVENIYQLMGHDQLLLKNGAHAGHIVGFTGLDGTQAYKNLTVVGKCCLKDCLGMFSQHETIVEENSNIICVSIEPKKVVYLNELQEALRLLEKSDPIVNISIASTGEMLLYAAGEIHLQKCLNDLTTRIVPHIELDVSPPIVPFRETVTHRALCNMPLFDAIKDLSQELKMLATNIMQKDTTNLLPQQGVQQSTVVYIRLPQKTGTNLCCRVSLHSLPVCLIEWIEKHSHILSQLNNAIKAKNELSKSDVDQKNHLLSSLVLAMQQADKEELEMCENTDICTLQYSLLIDRLWAIGNCYATQTNMLFTYIGHAGMFSLNEDVTNSQEFGPFAHSIMKGFQRALKEGPFCKELVKNTALIVHDIWETSDDTHSGRHSPDGVPNESAAQDGVFGSDKKELFSSLICNPGQMSFLITKAFQIALMSHPGARLMIATYKVDLEVRINTFKNLSSIINQLHGQIVKQDVNFGNFIVEARIPVIESFGFGDKLRKKTSGEVGLPQLKTVLWELLNCSPLLDMNLYKTIVDRAENCDIGITPELVARTQTYINNIRTRKGMQVRQQLVESGDKQRTLSKKK